MYLQLSTFGQQLMTALPQITANLIPADSTLGETLSHFDSLEKTSDLARQLIPKRTDPVPYLAGAHIFHMSARSVLRDSPVLEKLGGKLSRSMSAMRLEGIKKDDVTEASLAHDYFRELLKKAVNSSIVTPKDVTVSFEDRFALQRLRFNGILGNMSLGLQAHVERVMPSLAEKVEWYESHLDPTLNYLDRIWQQWNGPDPTTAQFVKEGAIGVLAHVAVGEQVEIMEFGARLLTNLTEANASKS